MNLARVGAMARVGRFTSTAGVRFPRGSRVIARTARGLEVAEVLGDVIAESPEIADGVILRGMTHEDRMLAERLERRRAEAAVACQSRLVELGSSDLLLDLEHLFDGQSLVFYFLGAPTENRESLIEELARTYDSEARFTTFAETLTQGCGPDCGSAQAHGGECASCGSGCALAAACGK